MNDLNIGTRPSGIHRLPSHAGRGVAQPFNGAATDAVEQAIASHRALEARMAAWAQRYAEWREAQKLLDILEKRGFGALDAVKAKVEQLRDESQRALDAVQLRLGPEPATPPAAFSPAADS
jgi:hypothetical protein